MPKIGAMVTYGKRYNLTALFALTEDDDDGNTAVGRMDKPITTSSTATAPVATSTVIKAAFKSKSYSKPSATSMGKQD